MRLGNRIAVFGGSGFIGREVMYELAHAGYELTCYVRRPERYRDISLLPNTRVRGWTPLDDLSTREALEGHTMLLNLTVDQSDTLEAIAPEDFPALAKQLQKSAAKVGIRRILHLSYLDANAQAGGGWAKQLAEMEAALHAVPSAQTTTFRTSLVIGEGDDNSSRYRDQLKRMAFVPVYGAEYRFQPLWVKDLARLIKNCVRNKASFGQRWTAVGDDTLTLKELAQEVAEIMGVESPIVFSPCPLNARLLLKLGPLAPSSLHPAQLITLHGDRLADNADFETQFGFKPTEVEVALSTYVTPHDIRHRYNFFRKEAGRDLNELPRELL
ncbi:NADH dehydrogenase [Sulfurivirga caldicuralii]|uniref:NADH dehydrogenase n=1 Tax=Sulfurivirga caldicuralii TaxID=364032 RepID=A0A1N6DJ97_9GAMM|nr:NAD(P)H-binding protein [Sulfurivirga caldicuralii]SIN70865.1 NADH dehydrogenase [Sulfurivirga caldicuralii]